MRLVIGIAYHLMHVSSSIREEISWWPKGWLGRWWSKKLIAEFLNSSIELYIAVIDSGTSNIFQILNFHPYMFVRLVQNASGFIFFVLIHALLP